MIDLSEFSTPSSQTTNTNPFASISTGFSDNAAENALVQANNQSFQNYQQNFLPLIENMLGELNSTQLVDEAKSNAGQLLGRTTEMQNRASSRHLGSLTPAQRMAMQRRNDLNSRAQDNHNVNDARVKQDDLNFQNMTNLMNIAVGNQQSAVEGLANGTGLSSSRNQAHANAKAQARSTNMGLATSLGAMALMAI